MLSAILLLAGLVLIGCVQGENNIYYDPAIVSQAPTFWSVLLYLAYGVLLSLPIAIDIGERYSWKSFVSKA